ncbi:phosphatidylethanolamine/phosphatidyl-N-methylethanolamine N-methyltransferase [Meinhardsimonia xiamenensis]|jgi:phosphatidylethanolamine/phosphatidyl-N-methylethanolamine N-methyltransferase|uniref:Phosphatidylethanolamine/phosphatidyl-N-methylethanolamine N-methyltransferase n=1 Tax=Meinhardsimonia xiamenensis TaxID=990712 RepID=A0A1G9EHY0_9RHOB|nr:class I SAM-dependent methyltransferase [Meinhardsimonia xiamenensis]PRX33759.1 phosphatidylethanolamine/phosphatidyl-N-methylethanolamine N-methyltransferase [Meinhardsimonia xiamenensis]SDK75752.1 phosphatidylethanolamine/phosphatidyl-N-methylethanolamine N-methyltransferase [Meinhardsimonia xiamenensis]
MDIEAVEASYSRWAPIYDRTFGAITQRARRRAVACVCREGREVLEVGVGTGLALPLYKPGVSVTGIDFSEPMLEKARRRVAELRLGHVKALLRMDARALEFADESFDTVAAMHVLSVVPEPERVMREIARVLKPGGRLVILNHFARERGPLARVEKAAAPLSDLLGWHSDFRIETVLGEPALRVERRTSLPPMGMMTLLEMRKVAG